LEYPENKSNYIYASPDGAKVNPAEQIFDKNFLEFAIQEVKFKIVIDAVKGEKLIMVTTRKIDAAFIDSKKNRSTCLKSFQKRDNIDPAEEWARTYHDETMKITMNIKQGRKIIDINFNETHFLLNADLLLRLEDYLEIKDEVYPEGFEQANTYLGDTTIEVLLHYNNASIGFPEINQKNAIISRGDFELVMSSTNSKNGQNLEYQFLTQMKEFEFFSAGLEEYMQVPINRVCKRNIMYPSTIFYKHHIRPDEDLIKLQTGKMDFK
jgi:hypothetical protein